MVYRVSKGLAWTYCFNIPEEKELDGEHLQIFFILYPSTSELLKKKLERIRKNFDQLLKPFEFPTEAQLEAKTNVYSERKDEAIN
jgi:hypothetical protein